LHGRGEITGDLLSHLTGDDQNKLRADEVE
jgi:hypothetical protein